ncbi:hypothetical protein GX51_02837 [Blastomyces parvus]|uniref:CENP-V/GFA domain-containing protein n=1 Tax=Blastomyces parvus TaxID=2060905 RepID=A0A2B7XAF0_9EURO|nr:hypothetical protein GX51_02837 [Blastomyces parvus]
MATRITCLCNRASQTVALDWLPASGMGGPSVLPFCHCDVCRRTTGLLCTSYIPLRQGKQSGPNLNGLVEYIESTTSSRWFCGTCGAHVFLQLKGNEEQGTKFMAARGTIEDSGPQTESILHLCLATTVDGSIFGLAEPAGRVLQRGTELNTCFTGAPRSAPAYTRTSWTSEHLSNDAPRDSSNPIPSSIKTLAASCQCEGVKLFITTPNQASRSATSPWTDVLVPYHSSTPHPDAAANPNDVKWWLCDNGTKYLAGLCACNSCRLASGFPIQSWTFISRSNIFKTSDGSNLAYDDLGTLKQYKSSPGVFREFCGVCGATVFWHSDERPGVVDVSVGLLRAETGVRAEDWLHWELGRISFEEHAVDQGMIRCLKEDFGSVGPR